MAREWLQIGADTELVTWLNNRAATMAAGSAALQARTELTLWRDHLAAELRGTTWTLAEIGCIADVLNRPLVEPAVGSLLWADLADAFEGLDNAYGRKWGIEESALVEKARRLGPTACHALTAAIAQWWDSEGEHSADGWRPVGLRVFTDG
ncbi:MAG: hypothetical protein KBG77_06195 [Dermatophilaceae bacterium]|nr:hypothetical protein [Dermatophilaceae bacterium]